MGSTKKRIYTCIRNLFMLLPESIIRKYENCVELRLKKLYYSSECPYVADMNKTMIAVIDNKVNSGGLSDRINGIISSFKVSQLVGYDFKILHSDPFELESYLVPNKYNWSMQKKLISYGKSQAVPVFIRALNRQNINKRILSFKQAVLSKNQIQQYHCYTNLILFSDEEFNSYFQILFRPSPILQEAIDFNTKKIGGKYVSITFRFQQLLGDFKEGNFPTLDEEGKITLIDKCLDVVKKISSKHKEHEVLVTSDSKTFLDKVAKLPRVYTIPGKLVHMAFTSDHSVETHLKSFVDLFMIANADKVYLVHSDKLYNSGFPRLASKIYSKPFESIFI